MPRPSLFGAPTGVARALACGAQLLLLGVTACGSEEATCPPLVVSSDTECSTTEDCVEAGFTTLRCVNQVCAIPCVTDDQCVLLASDECVAELGPPPAAVCEAQTCQLACPETPCGGGEVCHRGRCVLFFEDFEVRPGEVVGSFERFGWNGLETELPNRKTRIVANGVPGCALGLDTCAGPAASGDQYALLGTQETSEKGTAVSDRTCRPCACCLECTVSPYPNDPNLRTSCPVLATTPEPLMCPAPAPTCADVCAACAACPDASGRSFERLTSCEQTAAAKTCPSCPCDGAGCQDCRTTTCQTECVDLDSPDCRACEQASCPVCADCRACNVCDEATNCEQVDASSARCRAKRLECDALGDNGCFSVAVAYLRSELSPAEQSLISPEINLAGQSGNLVLSFAYVPFSVGETYFESRQGVPARMWMEQPQEVLVELCGSSCGEESSWQQGSLRSGAAASVPPEARRSNGLSVGKQSLVDWRSGRVEVSIPESLRTSSFRFRFRPRVSDGARLGLDDIWVVAQP